MVLPLNFPSLPSSLPPSLPPFLPSYLCSSKSAVWLLSPKEWKEALRVSISLEGGKRGGREGESIAEREGGREGGRAGGREGRTVAWRPVTR